MMVMHSRPVTVQANTEQEKEARKGFQEAEQLRYTATT